MLYAFFWVITRHLEFICQTPGNYSKESIQHTEYGESLKSRMLYVVSEMSVLNTHCTHKFMHSITQQGFLWKWNSSSRNSCKPRLCTYLMLDEIV